MNEENEKKFNARDAARFLEISERTLYRILENREIGYVAIGSGRGRIRIKKSEIEAYIQRRTVEPVAA